MSQPTDGPITRRSARLAATKHETVTSAPTTPIRKSTRLNSVDPLEPIDEETSSKPSASKRHSFNDVTETESSKSPRKKALQKASLPKVVDSESSDEDYKAKLNTSRSPRVRRSTRLTSVESGESTNGASKLTASTEKNESEKSPKKKPAHLPIIQDSESSDEEYKVESYSPRSSPTRRSARLARGGSVDTSDKGTPMKSAANKRLSFTDIAKECSNKSPKKNAKKADLPITLDGGSSDEGYKAGSKSPRLSPIRRSARLARGSSIDVNDKGMPTKSNATKRISFTDITTPESKKSPKKRTNQQSTEDDSTGGISSKTIELSDEEETCIVENTSSSAKQHEPNETQDIEKKRIYLQKKINIQ
jgi:hypothetical protein